MAQILAEETTSCNLPCNLEQMSKNPKVNLSESINCLKKLSTILMNYEVIKVLIYLIYFLNRLNH